LEKEKDLKKRIEVDSSKKIINERVEKNIDKDIVKINKLVNSINDDFDKNSGICRIFYKKSRFFVLTLKKPI
jgi:hypothetical protein